MADKDENLQEEDLQQQIDDLQKKLTEQEEITKRAQSDYFRLKLELDAYTKRVEESQEATRVESLVKMGQKLLPFVTNLQQTVAQTPEELNSNTWVEGVQLVANKSLQEVQTLGIEEVSPEVGSDPDLTLHMPINMQDVEEDDLKGKVVQVVESGWVYTKDGQQHVILPAKIVVGA